MRSLVVCYLFILLSFSLVHAQDVQGDVYVEASVDNSTPYIGQQITYNFKLYDAVGLANPLYQPSDFEGFWRIDMGVMSQSTELINGRSYSVTTITTALYPTHSGSITIPPSSVVLPETVFRSKQTITTKPISLDVKSLPETNSIDFSGAVGQFTMSAILDRQAAKVGEPVIMTVTVSGTGDIEHLPLPNVPNNRGATINAGNYRSEIQNGLIVGTRDYQVVFIPTATGTQNLPVITLDYFDPDGANFKSMSTSPIQIQVTSDEKSIPTAPLDLGEEGLRLKPIDDLSMTSNAPNFLHMVVAALLPIGILAGVWYQQMIKTRRSRSRAKMRQQHALQVALADLKAMTLGDSKASYKLIDNIFKRYVADKLDVNLEILEHSELSQLLASKNVSEGAISKLLLLNSEINEGLFSPASEDILSQRRDEIAQCLRAIDQEWVLQ